MSKARNSQMTRREILKTVTGAAVAGVAGLGLSPAKAQQAPAGEKVEVLEVNNLKLKVKKIDGR